MQNGWTIFSSLKYFQGPKQFLVNSFAGQTDKSLQILFFYFHHKKGIYAPVKNYWDLGAVT